MADKPLEGSEKSHPEKEKPVLTGDGKQAHQDNKQAQGQDKKQAAADHTNMVKAKILPVVHTTDSAKSSQSEQARKPFWSSLADQGSHVVDNVAKQVNNTVRQGEKQLGKMADDAENALDHTMKKAGVPDYLRNGIKSSIDNARIGEEVKYKLGKGGAKGFGKLAGEIAHGLTSVAAEIQDENDKNPLDATGQLSTAKVIGKDVVNAGEAIAGAVANASAKLGEKVGREGVEKVAEEGLQDVAEKAAGWVKDTNPRNIGDKVEQVSEKLTHDVAPWVIPAGGAAGLAIKGSKAAVEVAEATETVNTVGQGAKTADEVANAAKGAEGVASSATEATNISDAFSNLRLKLQSSLKAVSRFLFDDGDFQKEMEAANEKMEAHNIKIAAYKAEIAQLDRAIRFRTKVDELNADMLETTRLRQERNLAASQEQIPTEIEGGPKKGSARDEAVKQAEAGTEGHTGSTPRLNDHLVVNYPSVEALTKEAKLVPFEGSAFKVTSDESASTTTYADGGYFKMDSNTSRLLEVKTPDGKPRIYNADDEKKELLIPDVGRGYIDEDGLYIKGVNGDNFRVSSQGLVRTQFRAGVHERLTFPDGVIADATDSEHIIYFPDHSSKSLTINEYLEFIKQRRKEYE